MSSSASSGFVIKALDLCKLLPERIHEDYKKYINEKNLDDIETIITDYLPDKYPVPGSFFTLNDDDGHDGSLELDTVYAYYDEDDLYHKVPTDQHLSLQDSKITPSLAHWVKWG